MVRNFQDRSGLVYGPFAMYSFLLRGATGQPGLVLREGKGMSLYGETKDPGSALQHAHRSSSASLQAADYVGPWIKTSENTPAKQPVNKGKKGRGCRRPLALSQPYYLPSTYLQS